MKKFILLSSQRTGSGYLEQCLDSHPDVVCGGEILLGYGGLYHRLPPDGLSGFRRLRTLHQAIASGALIAPGKTINDFFGAFIDAEAVGFKLMYNQISRDWRVRKYLKSEPIPLVIHLKRKNLLKQYASIKIMRDQAKYGRATAHVYESQKPVSIVLDPDEAVRFCRTSNDRSMSAIHFFETASICDVYYEDMVSHDGLNPQVSELICDFLGVESRRLFSPQVKGNSDRLVDVIENYDEVESAFRDQGLSSLMGKE